MPLSRTLPLLSILLLVGPLSAQAAKPVPSPLERPTLVETNSLGPDYLTFHLSLQFEVSGLYSIEAAQKGNSSGSSMWQGHLGVGLMWRDFLRLGVHYERGAGERAYDLHGMPKPWQFLTWQSDRFALEAAVTVFRWGRFRIQSDVQGFFEDTHLPGEDMGRSPFLPGSSQDSFWRFVTDRYGLSFGTRLGIVILETDLQAQLSAWTGCRISGYFNPSPRPENAGFDLSLDDDQLFSQAVSCSLGARLSWGL